MVEKAKRPSHDQIVTFEEIRSQIETELTNPNQTSGIKSMWLPSMNTILKVHFIYFEREYKMPIFVFIIRTI